MDNSKKLNGQQPSIQKKWFVNQLHYLLHKFGKSILLCSTKRFILLAIAHHANKTGYAWASYQVIANHTGFKRRAIIKHITDMEVEGILTITERYKNSGDRDSNGIQIHLNRIVDNYEQVVSDEHQVVHEEHQGGVFDDKEVVFNMHPNKLLELHKETTQDVDDFLLVENPETKAVEDFVNGLFTNGLFEEH